MAGAAKAAGLIAAGGGPEDPVADVAAAKTMARKRAPAKKPAEKSSGNGDGLTSEERAKNRERRAQESHRNRQQDRKAKLHPPKVSRSKKSMKWAWSGNRKLLVVEFVACMVVLGAGTLLAPEGSKDGVPRAMVKASALCGLFLILALVASGGTGPAKTATALATLVTAGYVLTSSDVRNVVKWVDSYFSKTGDVTAKQPTGSAEELV